MEYKCGRPEYLLHKQTRLWNMKNSIMEYILTKFSQNMQVFQKIGIFFHFLLILGNNPTDPRVQLVSLTNWTLGSVGFTIRSPTATKSSPFFHNKTNPSETNKQNCCMNHDFESSLQLSLGPTYLSTNHAFRIRNFTYNSLLLNRK